MKDYSSFSYNFPPKAIASESEVKEVKDIIKSCIVSEKGGMSYDTLQKVYKQFTNEEIPFLQLGYCSLFHLLRDIPEVYSSRDEMKKPVLMVKSDKTQHLQDMIKNQKDPKIYMRTVKKSNTNKNSSFYERKTKNRQDKHDAQRNISANTEKIPPVDENIDRPVIYNSPFFEDEMSTCTTPIVGTSQLIGDDYFLQLCIKYLTYPLKRKDRKSAITCGTVQSGLTIKKAIRRLDKIDIMSNKIVINVGTVDIYNRQTRDEMVEDYKNLLDKLTNKYGYSPSQITLCTLSPAGNIGIYSDQIKYTNHITFNNWLRDFAEAHNYKLLDLYSEFVNSNLMIDYQYFQENARRVSGTFHSHVLWNYWGRQKVMKLLLNL